MASTNRIFIAFAIEDESQRNLLSGQAKNEKSTFTFIDMSIQEPFDEAWKTKCRAKITGCDGAIVLISDSTRFADGQRWEIKTIIEENVPLLAIYAYNDHRGSAPSELGNRRIYSWTWSIIKSFLDSL